MPDVCNFFVKNIIIFAVDDKKRLKENKRIKITFFKRRVSIIL